MKMHDKNGLRRRVAALIYSIKTMPDGSKKLAVILHSRGEYDFEKNQPETFPYLFQPSCHGKLDGKERLMTALKREMSEEIGGRFCEKAWPLMKFSKVYEEKKHDRRTITYATFIPFEPLKLLQLWSGSAGFAFVTKEEFEHRAIGVCTPSAAATIDLRMAHICMIADELVAVNNGFELFRNKVRK